MTKTNRRALSRRIAVCALALLAGACGSGGGDNGGKGGSAGPGAAGSSGTAGTTGAAGRGGSTGAAGTQGAGGGGTAGTTGTGGTIGAAGTGGTIGAAGTGGTIGAAGTGGTAGGAGGRGGGAAGTTATAGSAGTTGSAGSGGGQGGAGRGGGGGSQGAAGRGGAGGGAAGAGGAGGGTDGGATDAVVIHDGATGGSGAFIRTGWTATYTCTGTCPAQMASDTVDMDTGRAFDGTLATRWSTGQYQQTASLMTKFPLYFTVDMKQVMNVSRLTMNPGNQDMYDAPGQMDVLVSLDGTNFTTAVAAHRPTSPVTPGTDTVTFPQATPARYIQLKATMTIKQVNAALGDRFWAIGEMNVYP